MVSSISGNNAVWTGSQIDELPTAVKAAKTEEVTAKVVDSFDNQSQEATPSLTDKSKVCIPDAPSSTALKADDMADFDVMLNCDAAGSATKSTGAAKTTATTKAKSPAVTNAINHLKNTAAFKALSAEAKTAVLAQCDNFPNTSSVQNLEKMLGCKWFTKMTISDKQRAAKSIAYLSEQGFNATNKDQKTIINNTLGRILSGQIPLNFAEIKDDPGRITYGYAPAVGNGIYINKALVPAGNGPFPKNIANARHAVLSTIPHEVSHQVNKDVNNVSYKYFQAEYRAWYVGWIAEYGRVPTRQEAFNRCLQLFNIYDNIGSALYSDSKIENMLDFLNKVATGDDYEDKKILQFMNKFIGASNINFKNAKEIKDFLKKAVTNPKGNAPAPDASLRPDMDN